MSTQAQSTVTVSTSLPVTISLLPDGSVELVVDLTEALDGDPLYFAEDREVDPSDYEDVMQRALATVPTVVICRQVRA